MIEQDAEINGKIRDAEIALDKKLLQKYRTISEEEIKLLVIENKWLEVHE